MTTDSDRAYNNYMRFMAVMGVLTALLVLYGIAGITLAADAQSKCLDYGWSDSHITITLERYCERVIGGAPEIRPLGEITGGG